MFVWAVCTNAPHGRRVLVTDSHGRAATIQNKCIQGPHLQPRRLGKESPVLGMPLWHLDIPTIPDGEATSRFSGAWIPPISGCCLLVPL